MKLDDFSKSVARDAALMHHQIEKQATQKSPWLVRLAVILGLWIGLSALPTLFKTMQEFPGESVFGLVVVLLSISALLGVWKLKRWGLYVTVILGLLRVAIAVARFDNPRAITIMVVLQALICIPPLIYWRRFR